jgi:iron complex outermembrane receptor protein
MKRLNHLAAASSLALALHGASAVAQTPDAPSPSPAASSQDDGEIVVTANKREQNLSKVGLSISALSGEALQNQRITTVADLAKVTPGLTFAPTPNSTPVYTLRGVGFFEASLAAYPDVSLYIDQVPLSLPILSSLTAFDLERVEVLKGPQGTLFGNNATGGAINFVAAKPSSKLGYGADVSYGRFNTIEVGGYITGQIASNLRARLAFKAVNGDEWQKSYTRIDGGVPADFVALGVPDPGGSKQDRLGKLDNIAGRFLLDWDASDSLRFALNVNGWRDQNDPTAPQYTKAVPQNPPGSAGPGGVVPADLPAFVYPHAPHNARAADWNPYLRPYQNNKFWQTALRADWDVTSDLTLTSLTGYSHLDFLNATDGDGMALEGLDLGRDAGKIKSFTQEVRLANAAGNALRFVIGGNYERTIADEDVELYISGTSSTAVNGFNGNFYGSDQKMKNYAAFGNLEYDVAEWITLKGGIRRTKADRDAIAFSPYEPDGFYKPGALGENSLTNFFNIVYGSIYGNNPDGTRVVPIVPVGDGLALDTRVNADGTPVDPSTYLKAGNPVIKLREKNTSWSLGVDLKPTEDLLFYANVSKGYKAGSVPTLAGAIYDAYAPVTQESLLDYEAGFKIQLLDRKLSINGAAFYYDYKDKQLRAKFVDPIFGALDKLVNVPKSKIKGAELSITARPTHGLSFSGSVTYLDAKVRDYDGIVGSTADPATGLRLPVLASFKGVKLPYSPRWQYALRADYEFPINGNFDGYLGAGVNGQSRSIGILTTSAQDRTDYKINARTLVDLSAGIATPDGVWRAGLWGKNVFNKYYWTNAIQAYDNIMRYAARPAEYGLTVSFHY